MLSEMYMRVQKDDFTFNDQKVTIHSGFPEYELSGDIYHEAGFDALMTGVVWYKMMTYLGRERKFPGVQKILETTIHNSLDKNKLPMANIRNSMNLEQHSTSGLSTDGKSFVFVLQNVPLTWGNEEISAMLTKELQADVKVYRAFNKNHVFFTVFGKPHEDKIQEKLKEKGVFEVNGSSTSGNGSAEVEKFNVISYTQYEKELKERIVNEDNVSKDGMPDYMWILN